MSISLILLLVVTLVRLAIFAFVIYAAVQGVNALRLSLIHISEPTRQAENS